MHSSNMPTGIHPLLILLLLILSTFVAISDLQLVVSRQRIRRRLPKFHAIEPKRGNAFDQNEGNKATKFILKCPRTKKNISSLVWSHNGRPMFNVNFLPNSQLEVGNNVDPKWAVEEKVWRSLDNRFELLLTAKKGRLRVEVENGGPGGRQWMVLKIDGEDGLNEDVKMANALKNEGEWKCQIFVLGSNGKHKLEAESRKRIVGKRPQRKIRDFGNAKNVVAHQSNRHWELWESLLEGKTFGFAKSDGEFAVFQRTDTSLGTTRLGDAIEYTRNEPMEKADDNLLLLGSDGDENGWRWRRANSSSSQTPLFLLNLFLSIISFFLFAHQIQ